MDLKNAAANCIPGEYKIADVNGDSVIDANDRVILGHGDPDFYGGLGNRLSYGRVSLDLLFTFAQGNEIINAGAAYGCLGIMQANERTCMLDRWTPTHTNTNIPRANNGRPRRLYSTLVEDGSYLRGKNLRLSYSVPASWLRAMHVQSMSRLELYVSAQNFFTITKYTGYDPETNLTGSTTDARGADYFNIPQSRSFVVAVTLNR